MVLDQGTEELLQEDSKLDLEEVEVVEEEASEVEEEAIEVEEIGAMITGQGDIIIIMRKVIEGHKEDLTKITIEIQVTEKIGHIVQKDTIEKKENMITEEMIGKGETTRLKKDFHKEEEVVLEDQEVALEVVIVEATIEVVTEEATKEVVTEEATIEVVTEGVTGTLEEEIEEVITIRRNDIQI